MAETWKLIRQHQDLHTPTFIERPGQCYVLGRDTTARGVNIRCVSEFVSRKHTSITFDGTLGVWLLKDLGLSTGIVPRRPEAIKEEICHPSEQFSVAKVPEVIDIGTDDEEDSIIHEVNKGISSADKPLRTLSALAEDLLINNNETNEQSKSLKRKIPKVPPPPVLSLKLKPEQKQQFSKRPGPASFKRKVEHAERIEQQKLREKNLSTSEIILPTNLGSSRRKHLETTALAPASKSINNEFVVIENDKTGTGNDMQEGQRIRGVITSSSSDDSSDGMTESQKRIVTPMKPLSVSKQSFRTTPVKEKFTAVSSIPSVIETNTTHFNKEIQSAPVICHNMPVASALRKYECTTKLHPLFQINEKKDIILNPTIMRELSVPNQNRIIRDSQRLQLPSINTERSSCFPPIEKERGSGNKNDSTPHSDMEEGNAKPSPQNNKVLSRNDLHPDKIDFRRVGPRKRGPNIFSTDSNDCDEELNVPKHKRVKSESPIYTHMNQSIQKSDTRAGSICNSLVQHSADEITSVGQFSPQSCSSNSFHDTIDIPLSPYTISESTELAGCSSMEVDSEFQNDRITAVAKNIKSKNPRPNQIKVLSNIPDTHTKRRGSNPQQSVRSATIGRTNAEVKHALAEERKQRLHELELKKKETALEGKVQEDSLKNKPRPKSYAKHSVNSKQDKLIQSIVEDSNPGLDKSKEDSELSNRQESIAGGPLGRQRIPAPPHDVANQLPYNQIRKEQQSMMSTRVDDSKFANPKKAPTASCQQQLSRDLVVRNLMVKPNALPTGPKSPEDNRVIWHTSHNRQVSGPKPGSSKRNEFELNEETIYKDVVKWRPAWLAEQKNCKNSKTPPVNDGVHRWQPLSTLSGYREFGHYVRTFYPLMLLELWATLYKNMYPSKMKLKMSNVGNAEYEVGVENIKCTEYCSMTSGRELCEKNFWHDIACHTFVQRPQDVLRDRDLAILTYTVRQTERGKEKTVKKDVFAFVQFKPDDIEEVNSSTTVHNNLFGERTSCKYKANMTLTTHLDRENFVYEDTCHLHIFARISSKLRDYKALISLPQSRLFERIISPPDISDPFDPRKPIDSKQLVSNLQSTLNHIQKSVVVYTTNRVMRNRDPDVMLLHGPPGTGKTRTIVAMILQLTCSQEYKRENVKILVCTPSNTAIDEIMLRLDGHFENMPFSARPEMVRHGSEAINSSELKKYTLECLAHKQLEKDSNAASIRYAIKGYHQEIEDKQASIKNLLEGNGSQIVIDSLKREIAELKNKMNNCESDLRKFKVDQKAVNAEKNKILTRAAIVCTTLNSSSNSKLRNCFQTLTRNNSTSNSSKSNTGIAHKGSFIINFLTKQTRQTVVPKLIVNDPELCITGQGNWWILGPKDFIGPRFTCCIVDEATQTTEPETLAPLLLDIDKLILVGDPNQLGATILSNEAANKDFGQSLFARLLRHYSSNKRNPVMVLTQQYRMHQEILKWPNEYFYMGKLCTVPNGKNFQKEFPLVPYLFVNLASQESSNNCGVSPHSDEEISGTYSSQISNAAEVKLVMELLRVIWLKMQTDDSAAGWKIGIITPYDTQKREFVTALNQKLPKLRSVEIDTVDSFQGREKDIILISCVRTDSMGFLKNPQRLNVALTRAIHSLIIVGDTQCLSTNDMWKSLIEDAKKRKCIWDIPPNYNSLETGLITKKLDKVMSSPVKSLIQEGQRGRHNWM